MSDYGLLAPLAPLLPLASRVLSPVLDLGVVFSFDRTGYTVHSWDFDDADLDVDLTGRVAVVTGANAGIGRATAEALAARGAAVYCLCRNPERAAEAVATIRRRTGNTSVHAEIVDVSEPASVRAFARRFPREGLDILVNNAGVLPESRTESSEGVETAFATNVVGPFLLTALLADRLARVDGRVVNVSSGGMYLAGLELADWNSVRGDYDGVRVYARTKRAEVVLAEMWAERLADRGVKVNAMHPGWADTSGVRESLPGFFRVMGPLLRDADEGADTVVWLVVSERAGRETGRFWFDRKARATHILPTTRESADDRARLWALCERLAGLAPDVAEAASA